MSFLKLEPQLDITATALHVFLETVGFRMKMVYGVVFDKIMQIIIQVNRKKKLLLVNCKENLPCRCFCQSATKLAVLEVQ